VIYLAGPIFGKTDAECNAWRTTAAQMLAKYSIPTTDPMSRDYRGIEHDHMGKIVRDDKADILRSKAVLVNCATPSWGTAMEIIYASDHHVRVFGFGPQQQSPWVLFHCYHYATSMERAIELLVKWYAP
jgi:nucleoside 2-deoxyribosyltransferase